MADKFLGAVEAKTNTNFTPVISQNECKQKQKANFQGRNRKLPSSIMEIKKLVLQYFELEADFQ